MTVRLREINEGDLEQLMIWRTSPEITKFMKTDPKLTIESQREWFTRIRADEKKKHWMIEVDERRVGLICLEDIDWKAGTTSWGYYIGEKQARSFQLALALEMSLYDYVFDVLDFVSIHNEVFSLNEGVIRIHQACGCEIECVRKDAVEKNEKKYDITRMNLTREKWYGIRDQKKYTKIDFDIDMHMHHIGYAVSDIEKSLRTFEMGGYRRQSKIIDDPSRNVRIAFVKNRTGGILIELVTPLDHGSPVSRLLEDHKNVAVPYHFCYEVENVRRMIKQLKRQSYYLIQDALPAVAIENRNVAFLLHSDTGMIELLEQCCEVSGIGKQGQVFEK